MTSEGKLPLFTAVLTVLLTISFQYIIRPIPNADAYDKEAHKQIVIDAVDYMLYAPIDKTIYVERQPVGSDYDLLRLVLSPKTTSRVQTEIEIRKKAKYLGDFSEQTDRTLDVKLRLCKDCKSKPGYNWGWASLTDHNVSFTMFSHFLNVHGENILWSTSGYYYGWVMQTEQNKACPSSNYQDLFANLFISHGGAKFDTQGSETFLKLKDPIKSPKTDDDYKDHFDQDIQNIHFWPINNLANHNYSKFMESGQTRDGHPTFLYRLGPVLHAVADTTVPFHAVGLSGCGHGEYEAVVERLVTSNEGPYNTQKVQEYLSQLTGMHTKQLDHILWKNASMASEYCDCDNLGCSCKFVDSTKDRENVARELYNLAVASTVTTLRKCLLEWSKQKMLPNGPKTVPLPQKTSGTKPYVSWDDFPVTKPTVSASPANRSKARKVQSQLTNKLTELKFAISNAQDGAITKTDFTKLYYTLITNTVEITSKFPEVDWQPTIAAPTVQAADMPPLGPEPIRFRPPTLEEIRDKVKWEHYLADSRNFYSSVQLYKLAEELASAQTKLKRQEPGEEKAHLEATVENLIASSNAAVSALSTAESVYGQLVAIEGDLYVIKEVDGKEIPLHVNKWTRMKGNLQVGNQLRAGITDHGHVLAITGIEDHPTL